MEEKTKEKKKTGKKKNISLLSHSTLIDEMIDRDNGCPSSERMTHYTRYHSGTSHSCQMRVNRDIPFVPCILGEVGRRHPFQMVSFEQSVRMELHVQGIPCLPLGP